MWSLTALASRWEVPPVEPCVMILAECPWKHAGSAAGREATPPPKQNHEATPRRSRKIQAKSSPNVAIDRRDGKQRMRGGQLRQLLPFYGPHEMGVRYPSCTVYTGNAFSRLIGRNDRDIYGGRCNAVYIYGNKGPRGHCLRRTRVPSAVQYRLALHRWMRVS